MTIIHGIHKVNGQQFRCEDQSLTHPMSSAYENNLTPFIALIQK